MLYFNGTVKPLIKRKVTAMTIIDNAYADENDTFLCNQEKVTSHFFKEETHLFDEYFDFLEMVAVEQSAVIAVVSVKCPCC